MLTEGPTMTTQNVTSTPVSAPPSSNGPAPRLRVLADELAALRGHSYPEIRTKAEELVAMIQATRGTERQRLGAIVYVLGRLLA